MMLRYLCYTLLFLLASDPAALARVRLPAVFSDHMVVQQKTEAAFWGWADPGEQVTIKASWSATPVHTRADANGRWTTRLMTPAAGGPFTIAINDITLNDVLSGEVWLCSGQSNMVFSLKSSATAQQAIARADKPQLRYFSVARQYARHDFEDAPGSKWVRSTSETAPGFSAVAWFFAEKIQETLKVPVGIIYSAWGGTPAEAWTPEPVLTGDTVLTRYLQRWQTIQQNVGADSVKYHAEKAAGHKPAEPQTLYYFERPWREPGVLFNGMIEPVIPFSIKGVLWYQGESNVNYADEYYRLMSAMIASWRQHWQQKDLPFHIVQISAFGYASPDNAATVREAEYQLMKTIPNTGTVVTADLGNMNDIHYTRKEEVGDRLALMVLAKNYGLQDIVWKGPECRSATANGDSVILAFEPSAAGLQAGPEGLKGFELGYRSPTGDSIIYRPAEAKIIGDKIAVYGAQGSHPLEVRYAWRLIDHADLFDNKGLPAYPFRLKVKDTRDLSAKPTGTGDLALGKPVYANSADPRYPVANIVDGKITRESKWQSGNITPPHILEINLQRYCDISKIVVHTGIPESERTPAESSQAAGFWSAKNFKLQYWDDANWTDIPNTEVHENRLTDLPFVLTPAINTFKLRFVCDDGEPISVMEIEVFGRETENIPAAGGIPDLMPKTGHTADQQLTLKITDSVIGKTMRYVGYNQGYYMPGGNTSGWLEYAGVNSLRVWTTLNAYVPASAVQVDKNVTTVDEFDRRKETLRASPEKNEFLHWDQLLPLYENTEKGANTNPMVLAYCLSELKRLHIDPIIQVGSTDFDSSWSNKWKQWQRYYALAFYCAKTGDVTMYAMQNEPNHKNSGPMKLDQWIGGMQIVSDALTCAIEDVNRLYGKQLKARMVGPVTAGNNPEWWTAVAKAQRTDYHGRTIDQDLLGIFSTHSYNSPAAGYVHRVADIRNLLAENQPGGKALPIVYTEIGRWMNAYLIDKEETMDDPSLFTEWGGIYANNTLNGAYGMWAFKFANTTSETYPMGIKSGHHFSWPGRRIVEDAYTDLAKGRPVKASSTSLPWPASEVTDGDKSNQSAWHSDSGTAPKWLEIDLGREQELGSGVVYTGDAHGDYTSPLRVKNFSLQYQDAGVWKDIPGFALKNNKYAQVFVLFSTPVTTSRIRFYTTDAGPVIVREIKVFAKNDGPADTPDYDVSGIQRTGEVVHLFAKGFKNEHPLLGTQLNVSDDNLHVLSAYDSASGNYYCWLVQRGGYTDHIALDLGALRVHAGTPVTAESVGSTSYGEVTGVYPLPDTKKLNIPLPAQTVMLLTIPAGIQQRTIVPAAAVAAVSPQAPLKTLQIALDASKPEKNKVSYIRFDLSQARAASASRILLNVRGSNSTDTAVYRFHVYGVETDKHGLPADNWKQLTWQTAPQLDAKEALIKDVGRKAFVAGELAMNHIPEDHWLDVTALIKAHSAGSITFALIRETRHIGDDADKHRTVVLDPHPTLEYWTAPAPSRSDETRAQSADAPSPSADTGDGPRERQYLVNALVHIADPVLQALSRGELHRKMPVEAANVPARVYSTHLEAFGRLLAGMAPWLELGPDATPEGQLRKRYIDLALASIKKAVDPSSPDFMNFCQGRQPVVDAAFFAQALLRAPVQLWARLDTVTKRQTLDALRSSRVITPSYTNWLMFSATIEAALLHYGGECDKMRLDYALRQFMSWYKGDGAYGDGPEFHWDYYNSFVIQPMLLETLQVLQKADPKNPDNKLWDDVFKRSQRYAVVQERMISPEATYPPIGRSLAYRFGVFHLLAKMALLRALPKELEPAQVRAALYAVIHKSLEAPGTFDNEGWLRIGLYGHQPAIGESYISTGSLYLCSEAFLPLGLPPSDPFWQGPDRPWTAWKIWHGDNTSTDHAL